MPARTDFKPGEFCWVDIAAHDLAAASAWYSGLFGWTALPQESEGPPYHFFLKGEAAAAAGGQMSDEMKAQGIPQCWNSYVCVADCAASEKRAAELGATVTVPTMEVPGHGKLCYILDPAGASVAMWESTTSEGPGVLVGEPGGMSWIELMCRDVAAAKDFYGKLFGWGFADMPMGDIVYTVIQVDGQDAGGLFPMSGEQFEGVPNHWMVYFHVEDCAATVAQVESSGGSVHVPPTDIPVGTFAVLGDPQGGGFSVITPNPAACEEPA